MTRSNALLILVALMVGEAHAADYRDCKEWFIYPTASVVPASKPGGLPWDNGSTADVSIAAKPSGRADLSYQVIGPKEQDAKQVIAWESVWPGASRNGKWFALRTGDSLAIRVIDRDAFDDDLIASGDFELPKELVTAGFGIFPAKFDQTTLFLAISATDGKRLCSGITGEPSTVQATVPRKVLARVDEDAFVAIKRHNKCSINGGTPACRVESYLATYEDANSDGTPDVLVTGGPFVKGSSTKVVALWLGVEPDQRKELFVGDCDDMGLLSKTEFTCTAEGKTRVVSYGGLGGVREASLAEVQESQTVTAAERSIEARANLKSLFTAQKSIAQEKDRYSTNMREVGFEPARGNRYAYFAAPRGEMQLRTSSVLPTLPAFSIVGPDEHAYPGILLPKGLKEAGCPLTFGTSADGEPIGLGVTGAAPSQEFVGYAIGNVDDDPEFDCWSVATFERTSKGGKKIPAGEPWHEKSDFDEGKSAGAATLASSPSAADSVNSSQGPVTLIKLEAGDRACYLLARRANRTEVSLPGVFELCPGGTRDAARFIGKRITFTSRRTKVLAASCEGDPACGRSDEVDLVVAVAPVR